MPAPSCSTIVMVAMSRPVGSSAGGIVRVLLPPSRSGPVHVMQLGPVRIEHSLHHASPTCADKRRARVAGSLSAHCRARRWTGSMAEDCHGPPPVDLAHHNPPPLPPPTP